MKIFVFVVAIAFILERNRTFQIVLPSSSALENEEIRYSKTFLIFLSYVKIFTEIRNKYDLTKIDELAHNAALCYGKTVNYPDLNTLNAILFSLEIQVETEKIIAQVRPMHKYLSFDKVVPMFIDMAEKFLAQAMYIQKIETPINLRALIPDWKAQLTKISTNPLSSADKGCLQMILIVEENVDVYTQYLLAVKKVPDAICEEIVRHFAEQVELDIFKKRGTPLIDSVLAKVETLKITHVPTEQIEEEAGKFAANLPPPKSAEQVAPPPPSSTAIDFGIRKLCPMESSQTYLMFDKYLSVIKKMEKKLDNFNSVAVTAAECYKITADVPELVTLNLILISMESEIDVQNLVKQDPHVSLLALFERITPDIIRIMDKFLSKAAAVQQADIHIRSWAEGWKKYMSETFRKPLTEEGKSCYRIVRLIEENADLYHSYFYELQAVPKTIVDELVKMLLVMAGIKDDVKTGVVRDIESFEPNYPNVEELEREISLFESTLKDSTEVATVPPPPEEPPAPAPRTGDNGVFPRFVLKQLYKPTQ